MTTQQKNFNKEHAKLRSVVERSFAIFFGKFRRFQHLQLRDINSVNAQILAACVLHNVSRIHETYEHDEQIINFLMNSRISQGNSTVYQENELFTSPEGLSERNRMLSEMNHQV